MKAYVLFHCDVWKSYDSYRLIGVVSKTNLKKALNKIKKECNYNKEELEAYVDIKECDMNNLNELNI